MNENRLKTTDTTDTTNITDTTKTTSLTGTTAATVHSTRKATQEKDCVSVGIIGLGGQGMLYFDILRNMPERGGRKLPEGPKHMKLVAVSTRKEAVLADCIHRAPDVKGFTDWKEMINSGICDAVIITTPHLSHPEIAIYALEHGVHVLCEKPASVFADDAQRINEVAKAHPELAYGVIFQQRCNPVHQRLHEIIHTGELGEMRKFFWLLDSWWRPDNYYTSAPWRATWKYDGGGILSNQAPHQVDLWLWLCGLPKQVYSICREGAYREIEVENDATILAQYESGATAVFTTSSHSLMGTDRLEINFSKGQIVVSDGEARIRRFHQEENYYSATMSRGEPREQMQKDPASIYTEECLKFPNVNCGDYPLLFENFARHLLYQEPLIAPGVESVWSISMANTALLSSWTGMQQPYPCDTAEYRKWFERKLES